MKYLLCGQTRVRVHVDDAFHQVQTLIRQIVTDHLVVAPLNSSVKLGISLPFEWEVAIQETEEQDSSSPDVSWRPEILNSAHDLRCHVRRRTTKQLHFLLWKLLGRKAKIDQLDVDLAVQKHIL